MSGILQLVFASTVGSVGPINTVAPVVSGTAQVRQTLSCTTGTWTGNAPITYAYQWQSNTTNIVGATSSTYIIDSAYVGTTIRCIVTATNPIGSTPAQSNSTSAVAANVPLAPTIGTASILSTTSVSVSFTANNNGGATITSFTATSSPGGFTGTSTGSPITVSGLNSGTTYTFTVTATNSVGTSAASAASNSVTPESAQPFNTAAPFIAGIMQVRQTLTCSTGTWINNPTSFNYYWFSSAPGFPGLQNGPSNTLVVPSSSTVGYVIYCYVTAFNAAGSGAANSSATPTISANTPLAPTIGTATVASSTSATVTFTANDNGGSAVTLYIATSTPGGLTGTSSTVSPITVSGLTAGTEYRFDVVAQNGVGNSPASALSNSVYPGAEAPTNTVAPTLSGTARVRNTLTSSTGTWTGAPAPTFTYQWQSPDLGDIPGATSASYVVSYVYVGRSVQCVVTGTNIFGEAYGATSLSSIIQPNTPEAPSSVSAVAGLVPGFPNRITVTSAVPNDGGAAITSYTWLRSVNGGSFFSFGSTSGPEYIDIFTGPGNSYTYKSRAVNSQGASADSPASNTVTLP
jgi:hypothetical protein